MYASPKALQEVLRLEEAVCWISGGKAIGTGFPIAPDILMTCFHCLYDIDKIDKKTRCFPEHSETFRCDFSSDIALPPTRGLGADVIRFSLSDIIYPTDHRQRTSVGFDVAIVQLNTRHSLFIPLFGADAKRHQFIDTSQLHRYVQQQAHLIHYPYFESETKVQRKISVYQTTNMIGCSEWEMYHQSATTKGSSGGPILSIDGSLLGMHRRCGTDHTVIRSARLASQALHNAGLRIDLFLRDAGFGFASLKFLVGMSACELPLVDVAVPELRSQLLAEYKVPEAQLAVLPFDIEQAAVGQQQTETKSDGSEESDLYCARCLRRPPERSATYADQQSMWAVNCSRCVRSWCYECLRIKAEGLPNPERWTCRTVHMRCCDRAVRMVPYRPKAAGGAVGARQAAVVDARAEAAAGRGEANGNRARATAVLNPAGRGRIATARRYSC